MDDLDIQRDIKHWPFRVEERSGKRSVSRRFIENTLTS
jgi:hypothetical protein